MSQKCKDFTKQDQVNDTLNKNKKEINYQTKQWHNRFFSAQNSPKCDNYNIIYQKNQAQEDTSHLRNKQYNKILNELQQSKKQLQQKNITDKSMQGIKVGQQQISEFVRTLDDFEIQSDLLQVYNYEMEDFKIKSTENNKKNKIYHTDTNYFDRNLEQDWKINDEQYFLNNTIINDSQHPLLNDLIKLNQNGQNLVYETKLNEKQFNQSINKNFSEQNEQRQKEQWIQKFVLIIKQ
ncbi:hypothetical protein PPERSA_06602 [Pseudocohnilembus persalinus]|uniref:Uncharacterized protein n=1 Tax=Pseudocohnilembus persalinus TaxID=266149 RepID=A0A0V0QSQ8_PSEPJ|nr:hypothetical protein PPERSA_06602 [Pseudocohnilembus persalinus]|eukprot:KRX04968.1 hypothetical protein PPERSA_06602 [Pseudocohnilembus persalinus]